MKTQAMNHQLDACGLLEQNPLFYALAAEQGTGKTWMLLADAERQYNEGHITGLLIIAPKGVHTNWIRREIPTHLSVEWRGAVWRSSPGARLKKQYDELMINTNKLTVFAMNIDAINTKMGYSYALKFLTSHRCMMVIDESQRIKNINAKRTAKAIDLGYYAHSRRIASGTMVTQGPQDLFSQFTFLRKGCLGTTSYRAFVSEYAEILPPDNPLVVAAMRGQSRIPMIIRTDHLGRPMYKNMDRLHRKISPMMYRIRKDQCLDLPEKIYTTRDYELLPAHRAQYDRIKEELRFEYDGEIDTFTALTIINKLRQVAAGFIMREGDVIAIQDGCARLEALEDILDDTEGQMIIWATYNAEIDQITAMLRRRGESYVEYRGSTTAKERDAAIDSFQSGEATFFVSNPAAGGVGITLTAAETVVYYGNSPSLEHRLQSEDRAHRIGLRHNVVYIDLVAANTVDERIAASLQRKEFVAKQIVDGAF